MKGKFKNIFLNLLLLFFTLLIIGSVIELSLYIFWDDGKELFVKDEKIGIKFRPNTKATLRTKEYTIKVATNNNGFLGPDYDYPKDENTKRIIMLGDSFVSGNQVPYEKTFTNLVEEELNKGSINNFEVVNLGVSKFGLVRLYLNLLNNGLAYDPDLAIINIYTGNDLRDTYSEDENNIIGEEASKIKSKKSFSINNLKTFLLQNSKTVEFVRNKVYQNIFLRNIFVRLGLIHDDFNFTANESDEVPIFYKKYLSEDTDFFIDAWSKVEQYLGKIAALGEEKNIKLLFVIIPTREQVHSEIWQELIENYSSLKGNDIDKYKLQNKLKDYFVENNLAYIDYTEGLIKEAEDNNEYLYYKFDGHLNELGHQTVADILNVFLRSYEY